VNVTGLILCTQAVVPQMVARGTGLIINIGSQAGVQPQGNSPVYAATKWAVRGFTLSMAEQLATDGVAVVGIYPGRLTTSMVTNDGVAHHKEQAAHGEEVARCVEFVLSLELPTTVTELGIKQLLN
jgi:NADP-dependent 3-hydroxy acid dehydrogenase YdfG